MYELLGVLFVLSLTVLGKRVCVYYVKYLVFYCSLFASFLWIPLLALRPRDPAVISFISRVSSALLLPLLRLRFELRGREHLGLEGPCVVVVNHQHEIDVISYMQMQPFLNRHLILAKRDILQSTGWFGLCSLLAGCVFVDRSDTIGSLAVLKQVEGQLRTHQAKLLVFPEGVRRNTGVIHEFKKGCFHLAVSAQLPVVPVVLSRYHFLDCEQRRWDDGAVVISALPPVHTRGLTADDVGGLCARVRAAMEGEFKRVSRAPAPPGTPPAPPPENRHAAAADDDDDAE